MTRRRKNPVYAQADLRRLDSKGLPAVASYQLSPETNRPVKITGCKEGETDRLVIVCLTRAEARKAAEDILSYLGGE